MTKNQSGMTLVEMIIVVSIIGALAVTALVYFRGQIFKGKDAKRKADMQRIQIAVEEYEKDNECYPLNVVCPVDPLINPYLDPVPCDPINNAPYYYDPEPGTACPGWYRIYSKFENHLDADARGWLGPNSAFDYYVSSPNAPVIAAAPSSSPGDTPQPTAGPIESGYFGCKSGVCIPIYWDPARPGTECDPHYQRSDCYDFCTIPANECVSWN